MAATVSVKQSTGSGPTNTTITNLRFKTADDPSGTDTTYPLRKPASGLNYSYVASVYLNADTAPAGTINNVKFYTDGSNYSGTGATIVPNGTFDSNITGWTDDSSSGYETTPAWDSSGKLKVENAALAHFASIGARTDYITVQPGASYTASADAVGLTGGTYDGTWTVYAEIQWFTSGNSLISTSTGTGSNSNATVTVTASAPSTADKARVKVRQFNRNAVGSQNMGALWDNVTLIGPSKILRGITTSSYSQATGTQGTTGDLSSDVYTNGTYVFSYTSAAPLSISGSVSGTGKITDYLQMQMSVDSAVTTETLTAETFTFRYDET